MKQPDNKGVFDSPYAQIVDSFNVYQQITPPPPDHPNAVVCVQCEAYTWRLTDCCMHCRFNMAAHTQEQIRLESLAKLRLEQKRLKKKVFPLLAFMLVPAGGVVLMAFSGNKHHVIYWVLIGLMIIIAICIKPLTEKMEEVRHQINSLL